ncbi:uncharacterized protein LOC128093856 [Culex pipiens pallens]|uniref:uncharacterized protein LOC128093856 n=1 Tax=Culex pipiens pallens TaxID=42434 RepID=UPI0022AB19EA|nr:uncharacterized protein LOC128093856 [Culex pipiens pallens]
MEHLNDLDFADDIVLFSQRGNDMQNKLDDLAACYSAAGLKVNVSKTKSMAVNTERAQGFTIAGENVEKVDTFQYLGRQIAPDGGTKLDISTRIKKARSAFAGLRTLWRSNQISLRTKLRIFNSNVKSVLLYGSETWCVSSQNTSKLQVFVNRCLRNILRAWWPRNWVSNAELHRWCQQRPIHVEIQERKWRWISHTLRKDAHEICREAPDWNPQGQRGRGRPRGSWRRSLHQEISAVDGTLSWRQVKAKAENRQQWKSFNAALCSTGEQDA